MSVNDEPAAQEQWTRCWLVSWATAGRATYSAAKAGRLNPDLAIDVSNDEIRVIDLSSDALIASAPLAEAKATPATRMGGFYERRYAPNGLPVLVVSVPGMQRLTIGCIEPSSKLLPRNAWRFSWCGTVTQEKDPA